MICNDTLNGYKTMQFLYNIYCMFAVAFLIIISISSAFIYFHWYLKKDTSILNINPVIETVTYQIYKWGISNKLIFKTVHITFLMT